VVKNNGNIGIGTTAPLSKLHINGGTGTLATGLSFGDGDTGIYETVDDAIGIQIGGAPKWRIEGNFIESLVATGGGSLRADGSSGTVPSLTFKNDEDTGIGRLDANLLSLIAGGVNGLNVNSSGNIGIGTTAPDTLLTIANNNYISGKNYAGTDSINIIKVNEDDEIEVGATMNISGNIQGAEDGGAITLFDMPVTSTPAAGTEMSATLKVDGQNILKIYAEADGSGGVQNLKVKPLTTLETVAGTTSMAPIKMQSGTLLTTPEAGTIEYDGTDFYLSI
jgi:hypothetical protein